MRLLLVYEKFVSTGGLENYLQGLASGLRQRGHEVEILTSKTDAPAESREFTIHRIPRLRAPFGIRHLHFAAKAKFALGKIPHDCSIGFGRTTHHDLHRAGGGCHQYFSQNILPFSKRISLKNRVELLLERRLYRGGGTKRFVVNSALVSKQLEEAYQLPPCEVTEIHTYVDSQQFCPLEDETARQGFRSKHGATQDDHVSLFVSREHHRKGLPALLQAWPSVKKNCPTAKLWIIGPPMSRKLQTMTAQTDGISVFSEVKNVAPFYQAADLFVHPTRYDACANTVLQAMASGLPGIISSCDGAIQFIEHEQNGWRLADPHSPQLLAELILTAVSLDPKVRRSMGTQARERVRHLTMDKHLDEWLKMIESLPI